MNATVQCLKTVPELKKALVELRPHGANTIVDSLSEVFRSMQTGSCIPPLLLLGALHKAVPRFAEKGSNGGLCQQVGSLKTKSMHFLIKLKFPGCKRVLDRDGATDAKWSPR
jgi:hypothetical protein